MSHQQTRSAVIGYWFEKAGESLAAAHREFEAGSLAFAMNRVYYAAFYAVSALLMAHNLSFKKHSGVRAAFHQKFIKAGLLERKRIGFEVKEPRGGYGKRIKKSGHEV